MEMFILIEAPMDSQSTTESEKTFTWIEGCQHRQPRTMNVSYPARHQYAVSTASTNVSSLTPVGYRHETQE
jgi:hypothetical protein